MYLKHISLRDFRNYGRAELDFSPRINVLIGANAQGKTNLLEAIYVLAMTRSHRTANDHELVNFDHKHAQVKGLVERQTGSVKLNLALGPRGKKAEVNHVEQARLSQYIGQMNVILFAPEDLALVKGAPSVRRRFIDMEFGQIDPRYLYALTRYRAVLKQRNRYLKDLRQGQDGDSAQIYLDVLSEQLARLGASVIRRRQDFLASLEKYASNLHARISQKNEKLSFQYLASMKNLKTDEDISKMDEKELSKRLLDDYRSLRAQEIKRGTTLVGPHRDDLRFLINGRNVQTYGSQGQQRTAALAVKLAEIGVMKEKTGEYPLLLLDDVLSELDGARQTHLLKAIQDKVQTFLTTPDMSAIARQLIKQPRVFRIKSGRAELEASGEKVELTPEQKAAQAKKAAKDAELDKILGLTPDGKVKKSDRKPGHSAAEKSAAADSVSQPGGADEPAVQDFYPQAGVQDFYPRPKVQDFYPRPRVQDSRSHEQAGVQVFYPHEKRK